MLGVLQLASYTCYAKQGENEDHKVLHGCRDRTYRRKAVVFQP